MKVLAVIPARGGSKGVKRKNIRPLQGKPLIAYAIDCAVQSKKISSFVVSTEDEEIASVAKRFQSPVIKRPIELAADQTPMLPVLIHALQEAEKEQKVVFDLVVLLQTTSPFRSPNDVDSVIEMFEQDAELDGVVSVVKISNVHPGAMYLLDEEDTMHPVFPRYETKNRQDMPHVYYRNGCIYAVRPRAMIQEQLIMVKNKKAYVMPTEWHVNIDEEEDFKQAETLVKHWEETSFESLAQ